MRASIAYLTTTSATVPVPVPLPTLYGAHRMEVLGYHRGERAVYLREHVGAPMPIIHVVRTRGEHAGRMIALSKPPAAIAELVPMDEIEPDAWSLTTRVVQRRALRIPEGRPIRKFAVQLTVDPVIGGRDALSGRTVVTAYLRPRAQLDRMWAIPGEPLALARVTYVGVPEGIGLDKHVALLVGRDLH